MADTLPPAAKRIRTGDGQLALYQPPAGEYYDDDEHMMGQAGGGGPIRTSSLDAPTMKLTGHKGSVYCLSYDPTGQVLCSGSFDMTCLLWSATGDCANFNVLSGHKNAVLDCKFAADSDHVATASADKHVAWWDANTGSRLRRFVGHDGIVNAVDTVRTGAVPLVLSGSDDRTARLWDARSAKREVAAFEDEFQITAVALSDDGQVAYTAGLDNCITAWDVRKQQRTMKMKGHADTVTCLSLDPKGTHLLSNSMDGTLKTWDIRPFVGGNRQDKTFVGGTHNAEKGLLNCSWSADGSMVTGGSADRIVHVWDVPTSEELYALPGHTGCVNSVVFHPKENVLASASSDKSIYVGELAQ